MYKLIFLFLFLLSCEKEPGPNTVFFASGGDRRDYVITGEFGTYVVRENANQYPKCGDYASKDFVITYLEPGVYHVKVRTSWSESSLLTIRIQEEGCNIFDASHWGGW